MFNRFSSTFWNIIIVLISCLFFTKMLYATEIERETGLSPKKGAYKNQTKKEINSQLNKNHFKRVGTANFSVLFWDIYQSTLLTTSGKYPLSNKQEQLLFEINYLKDISSDELVKRTEQQWRHIGIPVGSYQAFIPKIKQLWPDIKKGDTLSLVIKNQQSAFYFNQKYIGSITEPTFGQHFIDIWLASNTSQPKLREQLLGNSLND